MIETLWLEDEEVGFIDFDEMEEGIYLKWTYVRPESRLEGYWRTAVESLIEYAYSTNKRVFIDFVDKTTRRSPTDYVTNDFSRRFYTGLGFVELFRYGSENERTRLATQLDEDLRGEVLMPAGARLMLIEDLPEDRVATTKKRVVR